MARPTLIARLLLVALVIGGGTAGREGPSPVSAATVRTVTITGGPFTPGDNATVTWSGFTPDRQVYLYICLADGDPAPPSVAGAECNGESQVVGMSDAEGQGSAQVEMRSRFTVQSVYDERGSAFPVGKATGSDCRGQQCEVMVTQCSTSTPTDLAASAPYALAPLPDGVDPWESDDPYVHLTGTYDYDEDGIPDDFIYTRDPIPPPPDPPAPPSVDQADGPRVLAAGSDLGAAVYNYWGRGVAGALNTNFDFTGVTYTRAIDGLIDGDFDIALTAAPVLTPQQSTTLSEQGRSLIAVPVSVSTVGLGYNAYPLLPLADLRASALAAAGTLYQLGQPPADVGGLSARTWTDSMGVCSPVTGHLTVPYFRASNSDAAFVLSSWLDGAVSDVAWPFGVVDTFPTDNGNAFNQLSLSEEDVVGKVDTIKQGDATGLSTRDRIGVVDSTWAARYGVAMAEIQNASSNWVAPSAEGALATLQTSPIGDDHIVDIDYLSPDPNAYPMVSVTYALAVANVSDDFTAEQAQATRDMLGYFVSNEGQQVAQQQGFVPMPFNLQAEALEAISEIGSILPPPPDETTTTTAAATTTTAAATTTTAAAATTTAAATSSSSSTSSSTTTTTTIRPTTTATTRPAGTATTMAPATTRPGQSTTTISPDDADDAEDEETSGTTPQVVVVEDDPPPPDVFSDMFGSVPFTPSLPTLGAAGAAAAVGGQGLGLWRRTQRRPKLTPFT